MEGNQMKYSSEWDKKKVSHWTNQKNKLAAQICWGRAFGDWKNWKFSQVKIPDLIIWKKKKSNNHYTVMHEMLQSVDISTGLPEMKCSSLY